MNHDLTARSLAAVWHPCTQMKQHERYPLVGLSRGLGAWLYDFEGRRYLDAISSWWVNLFGHSNPRINAAVHDQLERLEHAMLAGATHEPVVMLSERLRALSPGNLGHCFYASDGAAAVEIALKMSLHYWRNTGKPQKTGFVSLANAYHGETLGALSVTDVQLFTEAYAPLLRNHAAVPSPDSRLAAPGESARDFALRCAADLESYLARHHAGVAAFILEPLVQAAGGMAMYDAEYLRQARRLCDKFEVQLIADEIAVGFGRSGTLFACGQAEIVPDFLCLSKGLSGGYLPLSVVMTRDKIYQAFYDDDPARAFLHSHSYSGNPLACRAALATLNIFEEDRVIEANRRKAAFLNAAARPLALHPKVRNFRNTGMIWAFEVDAPASGFAPGFQHKALAAELWLRPIGNTVYFMPPYIVSEEEMQLLASRTLALLD